MNSDIRTPTVRLLDEEQNMVGIVSIQEALERSRTAELDLVHCSSILLTHIIMYSAVLFSCFVKM
jgi:translation initiation factor IF-3